MSSAPANWSAKRWSVWKANRKKLFQAVAPNTECQHSLPVTTSETGATKGLLGESSCCASRLRVAAEAPWSLSEKLANLQFRVSPYSESVWLGACRQAELPVKAVRPLETAPQSLAGIGLQARQVIV